MRWWSAKPIRTLGERFPDSATQLQMTLCVGPLPRSSSNSPTQTPPCAANYSPQRSLPLLPGLASNGQAYDDPGNAGGGQSTNLHCYCNPRQAITPAAGYTAGAYTPGLSDGRQPCSDWDAVAMTGCEPGISDCNFAGTFTITDSGGNTSTYNIILDVGGAVLNKDCGDPPFSENLTDGSGNVIATVTTHCSSCTIELP